MRFLFLFSQGLLVGYKKVVLLVDPHEEKELVDFFIGCAQIGFVHTRHQVMSLVWEGKVKEAHVSNIECEERTRQKA